MRVAKLISRTFFFVFLAFSVTVFTLIFLLKNSIDDNYKINHGDILSFESKIPITAVYNGSKMSQSTSKEAGEKFSVDLKMFGVIPFSSATVEVVDEMHVAVLGNPFGMKIYTSGVLVIEISDVETVSGKVNPAKDAGIKIGDYIRSVNGKRISCNEDLSEIVMNSNGKTLDFEIIRNEKTIHTKLSPKKDSESGVYRVGIWVRDSSAGIGTLTFYSPMTNIVCGLGHGICDGDTDTLLSIEKGELVGAEIVAIKKGSSGSPGELKGAFNFETISDICINSECGVYGNLEGEITVSTLTEIALKHEVKDGKAQILCTVEGSSPKLYSCEIKKRKAGMRTKTQNFIITVTDKDLIEKTGGIVQGMSGSPIIQNGKLVGAVTHVFVDDCTKGYGIFAENMLETAQSVASEQLKEAS